MGSMQSLAVRLLLVAGMATCATGPAVAQQADPPDRSAERIRAALQMRQPLTSAGPPLLMPSAPNVFRLRCAHVPPA